MQKSSLSKEPEAVKILNEKISNNYTLKKYLNQINLINN
jgi:hypothetical protein